MNSRTKAQIGTIILALASAMPVLADKPSLKNKQLAAIHTQEQSIQKMKKFLKEHPGDSREPIFLIRLSDLYFEKSGISFQYTEGESVKTGKKLYEASLIQGIEVLSHFIRKYSFHASVDDAYFKRGKAYKELKKYSLSKSDFLHLLTNAPGYHRLDSALMDLGDYAQEANQHEEALKYYHKIETNTQSQYYALALHKAAWSYFNLSLFQTAIQYLTKEITVYQTKTGETPYLETAYQDLALFYFEGINKKTAEMNSKKAVELFQEISLEQYDTQKRPFFGVVLLRFAKLLKAYQINDELNQLKNLLIKKFDQLPETMEITMLIFEYYFDKHEYTQLTPLLVEANQIRLNLNSETVNLKFEKLVAKSLTELHSLVMKNKKSTELDKLYLPLVEITEFLYTHIKTNSGSNMLAVYSMAETSFSVARYTQATQYYLRLLSDENDLPEKINRSEVLLRLVSSRYQELKTKKLIQETIKAVAISEPLVHSNSTDQALMNEWLSWKKESLAFELEALKLKYQYFNRTEATTALVGFAVQNSETEEGQVAASLAVDTYVASKDWSNVYQVGQKILAAKNWKNTKFKDKVLQVSADSHLKITLASTDAEEVLDRANECIKKFKDSETNLKCKLIQAKTLVSLKQYSDAEKSLLELSKQKLSNEELKNVTLMKAEVFQKEGKLVLATHELEQYAQMTHFKELEMVHHILQLYWFQRNDQKVKPLLAHPDVCKSLPHNLCEQYIAANSLSSKLSPQSHNQNYNKMVKSSKNATALWALALLEQPQKISYHERIVILQKISSTWENVDPFLQIQHLDLLKTRVDKTVESLRKSTASIGKITSDPATIEKRIQLIQSIDKAFAKTMSLNWLDIKIKTMNELQIVYQDLVNDLKKIGTPDELLAPFIKKQEQLTEASSKLFTMSVNVDQDSQKAILLGSDVKDKIPSTYWEEWKSGVETQRPDYLYYLISLRTQDDYSSILRGLILLTGPAASEGYEMIKSAPGSSWRNSLLSKFEMKGAAQ